MRMIKLCCCQAVAMAVYPAIFADALLNRLLQCLIQWLA